MKPVPDATYVGARMPTQALNRTFLASDHRIAHRKKSAATAGNFTMHDCYEKLKELVPTIPKNKKITRVQILQHVIDYIQDLQSALESYNIDVHSVELRNSMGSVMAVAAQFNQAAAHQQQTSQQRHHHQQSCAPNRTPFTTIPPHEQSENLPLHQQTTQSNCNAEWQQRQYCHQQVRKLHPYDTPESSPESRPCSSC